MVAGTQILEKIYPNLLVELERAGAVMSDSVAETILYYSAAVGVVRRFQSDLGLYLTTQIL